MFLAYLFFDVHQGNKFNNVFPPLLYFLLQRYKNITYLEVAFVS